MPDTSSSSTSVDLSRLPPPTIVEALSYELILAELIADLAARLPGFDATVESEPLVKQAEVFAYRELLLRQQFNDRALQLLLAYATAGTLDNLGALFGVARLVIDPGDPLRGVPPVTETDDALRQRIVLAPESFSVAGPELAYVYHAKSADAGVLDASATSPAPGEVVVAVLARAGDGIAPAAMLAAVAGVVNSRPVRPLGDAVTVRSAEIVRFAVDATLFTFSGPDITVVLDAARAALSAYLVDSRKLGRDVTESSIKAALTVPGVQRVRLAAPAVDVVCSPLQAGHCTGVTITHGGYAS